MLTDILKFGGTQFIPVKSNVCTHYKTDRVIKNLDHRVLVERSRWYLIGKRCRITHGLKCCPGWRPAKLTWEAQKTWSSSRSPWHQSSSWIHHPPSPLMTNVRRQNKNWYHVSSCLWKLIPAHDHKQPITSKFQLLSHSNYKALHVFHQFQ